MAAASIQAEPGAPEFYAAFDRLRNDIEPEALQEQVYRYADFHRKAVLEVGCGNGYLLSRYARHGARTCGIDLTWTAVGLARQRFDLGALRGQFSQGDAQGLPFRECLLRSGGFGGRAAPRTRHRGGHRGNPSSPQARRIVHHHALSPRFDRTTGCSTRCTACSTPPSEGGARQRSHERLTVPATRLGERIPGERCAAFSPRSGTSAFRWDRSRCPDCAPCHPAEPCWTFWRNGSVGSSMRGR